MSSCQSMGNYRVIPRDTINYSECNVAEKVGPSPVLTSIIQYMVCKSMSLASRTRTDQQAIQNSSSILTVSNCTSGTSSCKH